MAAPHRYPRARVYRTLRSAHLERAHASEPATIYYQGRSYDFDAALVRDLDLRQVGPLRAFRAMSRSQVSAVEINEPLMLPGLWFTTAALMGLRVRRAVRRPEAAVVTYAIENLDPFAVAPPGRLRSRVRRRAERALSRWVWHEVDRVAYGTEASQSLYGQIFGHASAPEDVLLPALPVACDCNPAELKAPQTVVFLGALDHRKGIRELLAAWPLVAAKATGSAGGMTPSLAILGKGPLLDEVRVATSSDESVLVMADPGRGVIHEQLRHAQVLVLLSQRSARWREQIGLPILEGLAHGCSILASDETGIASWLNTHGHLTLPASAPPGTIADAIASLLANRRPASDVLSDLPSVDGRLAADRWLFAAGAPGAAAGIPS